MATAPSDRNLLFGIVALQLDFIDREQLIQAMHGWVADKSRSLGDLLVEAEALLPQRRELLEALVEEHLQQHDGDLEKSLVASSSLAALKGELKSLGDRDIENSLQRLVAESEGKAGLFYDETLSVGSVSSSGRRFRVLRPHARGGLGKVSVALDDELHRQVALKELLDEQADVPESRTRFVVEAEITGRLEHPGIVPVYGLGQNPDGRPFYAMRFIEGDSLKEAICDFHASTHSEDDASAVAGRSSGLTDSANRSLQLRRLLGRFVDVCEAIHYAHTRGVLHRDLKPGNIMLGRHGETLVVDWGLARVQAETKGRPPSTDPSAPLQPLSGSMPTQHGAVIGTPSYMAPEQAEGRLDQLGPATDVYGLGATLFTLLTGELPVEADAMDELLRKVGRGEIRSPRSVDARVPRGLDAICTKAMQHRPEDRYATSRELADDVERWLADEPVTARRESFVERGGRWLRRHRTSALAGALVLLVVSGVSLAASVLIDQERRRADRAAAGYLTQWEIARSALATAEAEGARADRNARDAGDQRDLALETLQTLIYEVQSELDDRPGMQSLKEKLLDQAIEGLNKISRRIDVRAHQDSLSQAEHAVTPGDDERYLENYEHGRQAAMDHDLAVATRRIGEIYLRTGRVQEAYDSFEKSRVILERLVQEVPRHGLTKGSLAYTLDRLALALTRRGYPQEAIPHLQRALSLRTRLVAEDATDVDQQISLAVSLRSLGDAYERLDNFPRAFDYARRSLRCREKAASKQSEEESLGGMAVAYRGFGKICIRLGELELAEAALRQSLELQQRRLAANPESQSAQYSLSFLYTDLGYTLQRQGRYEEARAWFERKLEVARRLVEADPESLRAKHTLQIAHNRMGILLSRLEDPEARRHFQQEIALAEDLARRDPQNVDALNGLAGAYSNLAMEELGRGDVVAASKWTSLAAATELRIRATGKTRKWGFLPDWVEFPLQVANPRRGAGATLDESARVSVRLPLDVRRDLLLVRCTVLAGRGQVAAAGEAAKQLRELAASDRESWFDAARCFALTAAAAEPEGELKDVAESLVRQALECVRRSIELGIERDRLAAEPDFDALRSRADWKSTLESTSPPVVAWDASAA